ncbi:hypothetical protein AMTRI_Chr07g79470 [Amborella trichopoda]
MKKDVCMVCMFELGNGTDKVREMSCSYQDHQECNCTGNVREMTCLYQYHQECICKWLECNQLCHSRVTLCTEKMKISVILFLQNLNYMDQYSNNVRLSPLDFATIFSCFI